MKTYQKHIAFFYKMFLEKREKGFVLVLTLMMISLLSVLAVTSFELVISTTRITKNHKDYLKALYTADAGVEHTLSLLSKVDWIDPDYDWTETSFQNLNLGTIDNSANSPDWNYDIVSKQWQMTNNGLGNSYTVILTMDTSDPDNYKFHLESTGTVSSFTKTIVADIGSIPTPKIILWMEKEM